MDKYEDLLERAIDQLPPEVFEHKRFKIPKAYSDCRRFEQRPSTPIEIPDERIRYCRKHRRSKSNLTR